jgi:hypothetical protein
MFGINKKIINQLPGMCLFLGTLLLLGFGWHSLQATAASGINSQLNYQGKLTDSSGQPVVNGSWSFRFRLYDASSGGNLLWTERWTATSTQVTTVNGIFSVALGSLADISGVDFNNDSLYLQVDLDADADGDWEEVFSSRKRLNATPYAFNTDTVDGFNATSTAAVANYLMALDDYGNLNLFGQGVSSTYATTSWLFVGQDATISGILSAGSFNANSDLVYISPESITNSYFLVASSTFTALPEAVTIGAAVGSNLNLAADSSNLYLGSYNAVNVIDGNDKNIAALIAVSDNLNLDGTGDIDLGVASQSHLEVSNSAAITAAISLLVENYNGVGSPGGTITNLQGISINITNGDGAVTMARGLNSNLSISGGTIDDYFNLYVQAPDYSGGTLTNAYGLYVEDWNKADALNYPIWTNDGQVRFDNSLATTTLYVTGDSYFDGNVTTTGHYYLGSPITLSDATSDDIFHTGVLEIAFTADDNRHGINIANTSNGTNATAEIKFFNGVKQTGAIFSTGSNFNMIPDYANSFGIVSITGYDLTLGTIVPSDDIKISPDSTFQHVFTGSGEIGLGTTTPGGWYGEKLTVDGNSLFDGDIYNLGNATTTGHFQVGTNDSGWRFETLYTSPSGIPVPLLVANNTDAAGILGSPYFGAISQGIILLESDAPEGGLFDGDPALLFAPLGSGNASWISYATTTEEMFFANANTYYFDNHLSITGNATSSHFAAEEFCLNGSCITSWPSGSSGGSTWESFGLDPLQITPTTTGVGLYVTGSSNLATTTLTSITGGVSFASTTSVWDDDLEIEVPTYFEYSNSLQNGYVIIDFFGEESYANVGLFGYTASTGNNEGITDIGLLGQSVNGLGVVGVSETSIGVQGVSQDSIGGYFYSQNGIGLIAGSDGDSPDSYALVVTGNSIFYGNATTTGKLVVSDSNPTVDDYQLYVYNQTGYGLYGESESGYGVTGYSQTGYGGSFVSQTGYGLWAQGATAAAFYGPVFVNDGALTAERGIFGTYGSNIGITAQSYDNAGIYASSYSSYGVFGYSATGHGIHGGSLWGYAGYFDGNVYINGNATTSYLYISGNATSSHFAAEEICLNGDCRTSWPTGGTGSAAWELYNTQPTWNAITPTTSNASIYLSKETATTSDEIEYTFTGISNTGHLFTEDQGHFSGMDIFANNYSYTTSTDYSSDSGIGMTGNYLKVSGPETIGILINAINGAGGIMINTENGSGVQVNTVSEEAFYGYSVSSTGGSFQSESSDGITVSSDTGTGASIYTVSGDYALSVHNNDSTKYSIYSSQGLNYFGQQVGIASTTAKYALQIESADTKGVNIYNQIPNTESSGTGLYLYNQYQTGGLMPGDYSYGAQIINDSNSAANSYGLNVRSSGAQSSNYGGYFYANQGITYNYGLYAEATGIGSIVYGIYAKASDGLENYAGYFEGDLYANGNVTTTGKLVVSGTPTIDNIDLYVGGNSYFAGNVTTTGHFEADSTLYVKDSKVGVGTAAPDGNLEIYGDESKIIMNFPSSDSYAAYGFRENDTDKAALVYYGSNNNLIGINSPKDVELQNYTLGGDIGFRTYDPDLIDIGGTFSTRLKILHSGQVGVGVTTTPWAQLSVTNLTDAPSFIVEDQTSDPTPFIITSDGFVGIGDLTPSNPLTVEGPATNQTVASFIGGKAGYLVTMQNIQSSTYSSGLSIDINTGATDANAAALLLTKNSGATTLLRVGGTGIMLAPTMYSTTVGATNRDLYIDDTGKLGYVSSARKYKENIRDITNISWLYNLQPVNFNYINDDLKIEQYGLIAEDVEAINSDFVFYNENGETEGVHYDKFIPILIKAVQEQNEQILTLSNNNPSLDLDVSDASILNPNLDTLTVTSAATFYGTLYVVGEAGFEHKVVFNDDIEVKGKIYASSDQAGSAVIAANATSTKVIFQKEYEVAPKVTATLTSLADVKFAITQKTAGGFTISLLEPINQEITFDWIALAVKGEGTPPVIDSLTASLNSVGADVPVELWAQVSDPDTDSNDLTFTWSFKPALGNLSGDSGLVYWTVGQDEVNENTSVTVTVQVSDGANTVSQDTVITVLADIDEEIIVDNPSPSSTEPLVVLGCTDQTASNYNDAATQDDGSCTYPDSASTPAIVILGCTDQGADNYEPLATQDDGSCAYPDPVVQNPTSTSTDPLTRGNRLKNTNQPS